MAICLVCFFVYLFIVSLWFIDNMWVRYKNHRQSSNFKLSVGICHSALRRGIQCKQPGFSYVICNGFRVGARNDRYQPAIWDEGKGKFFSISKIVPYIEFTLIICFVHCLQKYILCPCLLLFVCKQVCWGVLWNTVFYFPKHGKLSAERPYFTLQNTAFCTAVVNRLIINVLWICAEGRINRSV